MSSIIPIRITDQERDDALFEFVQSSPEPFSVLKHLCPNDAELAYWYMRKCEKLVDVGMLSRCRNEWGWYRRRETSLEEMDILTAVPEPVDLWLPFGLSDMAEIYPGNIIIFAGAKSSGKTCVALNIVKENRFKWDQVNYFNSEMGASELRKRVDMFDVPTDAWTTEPVKIFSRYDNFDSAVKPGASTLNIIDFLEIHDEFYAIGKAIKAIHDALKDSVCVIFLQKNPGNDVGLGGWRSIEVARLYLAMEKGVVKITDAKNWVDPENNPNGKKRDFTIYRGSQINHRNPWYREKDTE